MEWAEQVSIPRNLLEGVVKLIARYADQSMSHMAKCNGILEIVWLDAPDEASVWRLAASLEMFFPSGLLAWPRWRLHVISMSNEAMLFSTHPYLTDFFASGHVAVRSLNDLPLILSNDAPVILSTGSLSRLTSTDFRLVHGEVWQNHKAGSDEWVQYSDLPLLSDEWKDILIGYKHGLNYCQCSLPLGAAKLVDDLVERLGGKVLLIALEDGVESFRALRLGHASGGQFNLHAFSQYQLKRGAQVWSRRLSSELHLHMALYDQVAAANDTFTLLVGLGESPDWSANSMLPRLLQEAAHALSVEDLPSILALANFNLELLAYLPADFVSRAECWPDELLQSWRDSLNRGWARFFPTADNASIALKTAELAWAVDDWRLMRHALQVALHFLGAEPDWLCALAACEAATGQLSAAVSYIDAAALMDTELEAILAQQVEIHGRLAAQQVLCSAVQPTEHRDLCLEPLNAAHVPAFFWQYRDPQIALMADLAELADEEAVAEWLVEQQTAIGRCNFALMHAEYGFVGVVSYCRRDDAAFIYFWIGCDYQGMGLSAPAVALLIAQARADGVLRLFTSAFADNTRSRHSLVRADFVPMDLPPLVEPDSTLCFYAQNLQMGICSSPELLLAELTQLCAALDSPLRWQAVDQPADELTAAQPG